MTTTWDDVIGLEGINYSLVCDIWTLGALSEI